MADLETYKARWADFRTECANLDSARRWLFQGYANEDLDAEEDELWDRVWVFEKRVSYLSVSQRGDALYHESCRYADM